MNNPYPTPQQRSPQYGQQHSPQQYQQYPGAPIPQQQGRPSHQGYTVNVLNQNMQANTNAHNQLFQQYANSNQSPPSGYAQNQPIYFPPPQPQSPPNGLISPPQLHQERQHDDAADPSKNAGMMHQSNNNENEVRDILWGEQQQANAFWEQKFFLIYQKFEWFGSRFQMLKGEYMALSEQLLTVDSQQDWNELKHHHEEFAQKLQEMFQELIAVADQNQQLINQRLQQDDGVWQRRYHELLSNFKALQQKASILEGENNELKVVAQQGEQAQQQQNYPELLSHYRNLEEEYQKLYNAYNKLQQQNDSLKTNPQSKGPSLQDFQNMRIEYQRTLQAIHNQNDGLKHQCQGFYEQNEHLRQQLHVQAQSLSEIQHLTKTIQEKDSFLLEMNSQLSEWKKKYQVLQMQFNESIQKQSQRAQQIILQNEKQLQVLRQQVKSRQSQYNILAKRIQDQLKARQQLIHDHHQELSKAVKLQSEKHTRQRQVLEQQVKSLHDEYESLLKQSSQKDLTKYQIESQQKRISFLKDQNQQLIQQIKTKNQELASLRNVSLQVATYQNILEQYKALQKEKLVIQQNNRKQHSQLLQLKKKVSEVEHDFAQYKSITTSSSLKSSTSSQVKQLQAEVTSQIQKSSKLQSEVNKYKQLIQSKQSYIHELEQENAKTIAKLQYQQRLIDGAQANHQSQILILERKIQTLQKRNRASELEFRKEMTQNYQRQIKQLRSANEDKLKKIKRLEDNLHELTNKSTHLQKHSTSYHSELHFLQSKISSLQTNNSDLLSKLTLSRSSIQSLEQQLSSLKQKQTTLRSQLNSYSVQIEQADNLINSKNNIIVEYEAQVQQFVDKVTALQKRIDGQKKEKFDRIKKYEEEIQKLKDRLYNSNNDQPKRDSYDQYRYGSSYSSNRYLTFGSKKPIVEQQRNQEIVKLQANLIQQMNQQNAKLRTQVLQLNKKINSLESLSRVVTANIEQTPKKSPSKSKISVAERDVGFNVNLEQRLLKFNQRLENCIHDNEIIAVRDVDLTASQRIANHERDKREMQIRYEKQIRALKDQISSLTQQVNTLNSAASAQAAQGQLMDSDLKQFDKYEIINQQAQKSTQEELQFLRSKLNDQQKTNSALIKINQHLKKQLEESLQKSSHSTSEYYKLQWKQTQKNLEQEKQKNKKLSDENKRLKHENLEHDTKLMKQYELKIFNTELQLKELQRQNHYFKMLKTKAQNQKANLLHDVNVYSADIQTIKSSTQVKISQYERANNQLRQKCNQLERELYEVNTSQKIPLNHVNSRLINSNHKLSASNSRRVLA